MNPVKDLDPRPQNTDPAVPEARLAPLSTSPRPQPSAGERSLRLGLVKDLKLLFAALGAGTNVVPMGDNGRAARQLSEYAHSLRCTH